MDKRHEQRVPASGMTARVYAGTHQETGDVVVNLSEHGCFVKTVSVLPVRAPVVLELSIPYTHRTIQLTGRVVASPAGDHGEHPGIAVSFDPPAPVTRERLHELVAQLEGRSTMNSPAPPHVTPVAPPTIEYLLDRVHELQTALALVQDQVAELEAENTSLRSRLTVAQLPSRP